MTSIDYKPKLHFASPRGIKPVEKAPCRQWRHLSTRADARSSGCLNGCFSTRRHRTGGLRRTLGNATGAKRLAVRRKLENGTCAKGLAVSVGATVHRKLEPYATKEAYATCAGQTVFIGRTSIDREPRPTTPGPLSHARRSNGSRVPGIGASTSRGRSPTSAGSSLASRARGLCFPRPRIPTRRTPRR